jgi:hypothetical protein
VSTYELLKQAIVNKQQVIASYNGYLREMCPHAIGTKKGRIHCLFYQFGGDSSKGPIVTDSPNNWRCIPIEGLSNITVREGTWHSGGHHSRPNTCIDSVDIEVSF